MQASIVMTTQLITSCIKISLQAYHTELQVDHILSQYWCMFTFSSKFQINPHMNYIKRITRYLNGTLKLKICY